MGLSLNKVVLPSVARSVHHSAAALLLEPACVLSLCQVKASTNNALVLALKTYKDMSTEIQTQDPSHATNCAPNNIGPFHFKVASIQSHASLPAGFLCERQVNKGHLARESANTVLICLLKK